MVRMEASLLALALCLSVLGCFCEEISLNGSRTCEDFDVGDNYRPDGPRVLCCLLYVVY